MAIFTCAECNFSKTVADKMAGKKARCPKCNAVNTIPMNEPVVEEETEVDDLVADTATEATEDDAADSIPSPAAEDTQTNVAHEESQPAPVAAEPRRASRESTARSATASKLSKGWLMAFAGAASFFALGIAMFVMRYIDLSIICFGVGLVAFTAMAAMYSFGKK